MSLQYFCSLQFQNQSLQSPASVSNHRTYGIDGVGAWNLAMQLLSRAIHNSELDDSETTLLSVCNQLLPHLVLLFPSSNKNFILQSPTPILGIHPLRDSQGVSAIGLTQQLACHWHFSQTAHTQTQTHLFFFRYFATHQPCELIHLHVHKSGRLPGSHSLTEMYWAPSGPTCCWQPRKQHRLGDPQMFLLGRNPSNLFLLGLRPSRNKLIS